MPAMDYTKKKAVRWTSANGLDGVMVGWGLLNLLLKGRTNNNIFIYKKPRTPTCTPTLDLVPTYKQMCLICHSKHSARFKGFSHNLGWLPSFVRIRRIGTVGQNQMLDIDLH